MNPFSVIKKIFIAENINSGKSENTVNTYNQGVLLLTRRNLEEASHFFEKAAKMGHPSAAFNLFLLNGAGMLDEYDLDKALFYIRMAAKNGHKEAIRTIEGIESYVDGNGDFANLCKSIIHCEPQKGLNAHRMVCAAFFIKKIAKNLGVTMDFVAHELSCAQYSDIESVSSFVKKTGVPFSIINKGEMIRKNREEVDFLATCLDIFSVSMLKVGYSREVTAAARCIVVAFCLSDTPYAKKILGIDKFIFS